MRPKGPEHPRSTVETSDPPRLLDLYCGAGGACAGYQRAGFDVVGVDHLDQPDYPGLFLRDDALAALDQADEIRARFDAIHASPPCQRYARTRALRRDLDHPDLLGPTITALDEIGLPYIVENVVCAPYPEGHYRAQLCGSSFGLRVLRHRWFVTNWLLLVPPCQHDPNVEILGVYGASDGTYERGFRHPGVDRGPRQATNEEARDVLETPWIRKRRGLVDAIPPAYTEHVGRQLAAILARAEVAA